MLFYGKRKPHIFFILFVIVSEELASFPAVAKPSKFAFVRMIHAY